MKALLLLLFCTLSAQGSTYGADAVMRYFKPFTGEWEIKADRIGGEGPKAQISTTCRFELIFQVVAINWDYSDGVIEFSREVRITRETDTKGCHATIYENGKTSYFKGIPDQDSKILVMEALFPDLKQRKYLIIDFTDCPKGPPQFRAADEKP